MHPFLSMAASVALALSLASTAPGATQTQWPAWQRFCDRFLQSDGRVIDLTFGGKSTSEGQSYALFHALVAGDRPRFDAILRWTSDNLADGRLGSQLPAWHWGQTGDSHWGVKDRNAASDADLWLAYALLEAGRLWQAPDYTRIGEQLLVQVRRQEVLKHGRAGTQLLPGPYGFVLDDGLLRINPSYLPGFQLRYFAEVDPEGPWQDVWQSYLELAPQIFRAGVAPDNFTVDTHGRVHDDRGASPKGSYDAIRVYLWAGMWADQSAPLLRLLEPYAGLIREHGVVPEQVDPRNGKALRTDYSPTGFAGAILPFLAALGDEDALAQQRARVTEARERARSGAQTNYYDEALLLFGEGWDEGRYRFDDSGRVLPRWAEKK